MMAATFYGDERDLQLRAVQELNIRQQVFGPDDVITVPVNYHADFWQWYTDFMRFGRDYRFELDAESELADYPEPDKPVALWYSGGAESTYTLAKIEHLQPDLLSIDDYPIFSGPHRRVGQIHFMCAVVGAQLGYQQIYLGVEKNDLHLIRKAHAHSFIERTPFFIENWNQYHPKNQLVSICSHLEKEDIIKELCEHNIPITGTCDNIKNGWCRRCFKCFEAFYSAKVHHIDLGFRLDHEAFEQFHDQEYQHYIASGFQENPYNIMQYFVRLQMHYGLKFERNRDCEWL